MSSLLRRTWILVVMFTCLLVVVAVARTLPDKPQRSHKTCVLKTTKKARLSEPRHRRGSLRCTRKSGAGEKASVAPSQAGTPPVPAPTPAASEGISPAAVSPGLEEGQSPPEESEVPPGEEEVPPPEEEVQLPEEGETPPPEEELPPEGEESPAPEDPGVLAPGEDFAGAPAAVLLAPQAGVSLEQAQGCVGITAGAATPFGGSGPGPQPGELSLELVPGGSMPAQVRCPAADGTETLDVAPAAPSAGGVLADPIDPEDLAQVPFGRRSFWLQPWRSYLDTWPASRLRDALGINFNVTPSEADATARLLASSGFRLARVEISWNQLSFADPDEFVDEAGLRRKLEALREHGLRPLILLNANSGGPAPAEPVTLTTLAAAPAGARTVRLDQASAAAVAPSRTGFAGLSFGGNPDVLVTAVDNDGDATLSRPLPAALAAGAHPGSTLRYGPFAPPRLAGGQPNPEFQRTLAGWLEYVDAVTREASSVFGADGYDLEVWNELSFGSQFLDEANYYSPRRFNGSGSVTDALLKATVAHLRGSDGVAAGVGISDGFASQTPFASGGSVPVGTTALSKHLYRGPQYFPRNAVIDGVRPVDALGNSDSTTAGAPYTPRFTPDFASALPEYFLTATQTETLVRDLSPLTNTIYGVPHGRAVGPAGGDPTEVWMTEYNLNTNTLMPVPAGHQDQYIGTLTDAQRERVQAEVVLRSLVSMVAKGLGREYFFGAAHNSGYNLISEGFMDALDADPGAYPGDALGGETMAVLPRLLARFDGPGPGGATRQLRLASIAQANDHAVWAGDGTAAHPDLFDRDVLAVFPFQAAPGRFVVPVYVMTPNLTTVWNPDAPASSLTRFDLPDERFRVTLDNLPQGGEAPRVSAYDPLRDEATPARLVSRLGDRAVFEIAATSYPRLLTIDYGS